MNLVFFVSLTAALLNALSADTHEIRGRIFRGQDAEHDEFKFMAFLVSEELRWFGLRKKIYDCGGAIIGPNWILTAAHCVYGTYRIQVRLGSSTTDKSSISYVVSKNHFVIHPFWDKEKIINDIALVRIPMTTECDNIVYARLPLQWAQSPPNIFKKKIGFVMGWGLKGNDGEMSEHLQKARVAILSNRICNRLVPFTTEMDLCVKTSEPFGSICDGDSGGPLVLEDSGEIIGVASFSLDEGCERGLPAVFVRVTSYLPWISEVMNR